MLKSITKFFEEGKIAHARRTSAVLKKVTSGGGGGGGGGVERISSKHFSLTTKIIVKRHFLVKCINYFFNSFQKLGRCH